MPIYEYKCPDCGKVFEILHRTWKVGLTHKCPECGTDSPKSFTPYYFQFSPYLKELREGNMLDY